MSLKVCLPSTPIVATSPTLSTKSLNSSKPSNCFSTTLRFDTSPLARRRGATKRRHPLETSTPADFSMLSISPKTSSLSVETSTNCFASMSTSSSDSSSSSSSSTSSLSSTASSPPTCFTTNGVSGLQLRREGLKLSFQRSISEPAGSPVLPHMPVGLDLPLVLEPHQQHQDTSPPPIVKRCRMMAFSASGPISKVNLPPPSPLVHLLRPPTHPAASISLPTSPCDEHASLERTLLLKRTRTIDADTLASMLNLSSSILVVDCRSFMTYNVSHIRGAINVNCCDRFNRKRLQQGKAVLADLATTKEAKDLLKRRNWTDVVVYDECSDALESIPSSHALFLVLRALIDDARDPMILVGGLKQFQVSHRHLCEDHLMRSGVEENMSGEADDALLPELPSPTDFCDTKDIENHPATRVLPHLYLGNMRDASDLDVLERLGVRYVLNVTSKPPVYELKPGIHYKQLEAADNSFQNLSKFFEEAFEFIDLAKENHSGVLVHCQAGISRSPTIAVAYLMKKYPSMAMSDAYRFVKMRRSIISPNLNFMGQLWEFEQGLKLSREQKKTSETGSGNDILPCNGNILPDMAMMPPPPPPPLTTPSPNNNNNNNIKSCGGLSSSTSEPKNERNV